jgi:alkylhydroperoxidase family enzyme
MALLLDEIRWEGEPLLDRTEDLAWRKQVKRVMGKNPRLMDWVAGSPWMREASLDLFRLRYRSAPDRLVGVTTMVTSQENACRYCYGVARANLSSAGLPEKELDAIERDAQSASADEKERAVVRFVRTLSQSKPRPARKDREELEALGYAPLTVVELAYHVSIWCYANRVATFLAVPLEEEASDQDAGPFQNAIRAVSSLFGTRSLVPLPATADPAEKVDFGALVELLEGSPAEGALYKTLHGAFDSTVLPRRTKALMVAVVARSLHCDLCESEARRVLATTDFPPEAVEEVLSNLASDALNDCEATLIPWVRESVSYDTLPMQQHTKRLKASIRPEVLLEAVGVAALANALVRVGMLAQ